MRVKIGDIVKLSPGFSLAEVRSAPGVASSTVVGQMTTGSLAIVLDVLGSAALEARVLCESNVVGWVVGSYIQPALGAETAKQEIER